jgi:uncharacterized protein (DUF2132 family)
LNRQAFTCYICITNIKENTLQMLPSKDPLHGKTLEAIVTELEARYGWPELAQ